MGSDFSKHAGLFFSDKSGLLNLKTIMEKWRWNRLRLCRTKPRRKHVSSKATELRISPNCLSLCPRCANRVASRQSVVSSSLNCFLSLKCASRCSSCPVIYNVSQPVTGMNKKDVLSPNCLKKTIKFVLFFAHTEQIQTFHPFFIVALLCSLLLYICGEKDNSLGTKLRTFQPKS